MKTSAVKPIGAGARTPPLPLLYDESRFDGPAVRPVDTKQIQSIVQWANKVAQALIPVSSVQADSRCVDGGKSDAGLVVDLSVMNRVRHIDGVDAISVIEPGVTFAELDTQLANHGLRSFKPLLPRRTKSVLVCYLEREPIISPREQWDGCDPLATVEMVLGSGDVFRTGTAATQDDLETQIKYGLRQMAAPGPFFTDFMRVVMGSQGTLGVVSWGAVYCERIPALEKAFFVPSSDLRLLTALSSRISWRKLAAHTFIVNSMQLALMLGVGRQDTLWLASSLPEWTLYVNISAPDYLPEDRLEYEEEALREDAAALGLSVMERLSGQSAERVIKQQSSLPVTYYKEKLEMEIDEIFFISQLDRIDKFIQLSGNGVVAGGDHPCAIYIQPMIQGSCCHIEFTNFFEKNGLKVKEDISRFHLRASSALADAGGYFSRPYGVWRDIAYKKDEEIVVHLRNIKGRFDPNRVLKPGVLI